MNSPTCIFCQIAEKVETASIVYADDEFLALMDAYPLTSGHCLVIPKEHVVRLDSLNAKARATLFNIGHKILEEITKA